MARYGKIEVVEARKHEGPRLKVVHDELGEQTANKGDYLVGEERGKVRVMPAAKFEKEFKLLAAGDGENELTAALAKIDELELLASRIEGERDGFRDQCGELGSELKKLEGELAELKSKPAA